METLCRTEDLVDLLNAVPVAVSRIGADGRYLFANGTYRTWFGVDTPCGRSMAEVLPPALHAEASRHLPRVRQGEAVCFTVPAPILPNPEAILRVRYTPVGDGGWFAFIEDISPCAHEQERLRRLAETDPLTGVHNRRGFTALAGAALLKARRSGTGAVLLMVDIDGFKQVNDRHGHAFGDEVLTAVAAACQGTVREGDIVGRLGGEEFGILLPGAGLGQAADVAERLRRAVRALRFSDPRALPVTASVGVAATEPGQGLDQLLCAADAELYRAKRTGRDRICLPETRRCG